MVIHVARNGDWLPLEELHLSALDAARAAEGVTLDLSGLDYIDGGALQIMLALAVEQKRRGHRLLLANVSMHLSEWLSLLGGGELDTLPLREEVSSEPSHV